MINFDQVKADAAHKWPAIFERIGIEVGTGKHCPCPVCGGKDRFRFDDKDGRGTWICNQCGAGDGVSLMMQVLNVDYVNTMRELSKITGTVEATPHQKEKPVSPNLLRKMFKESKPVEKYDTVNMYLKNRGLKSMPAMLRHAKNCYEPETKKDQEAMLAIFSDPEGTAITFHRTYLITTGEKLNIENAKKIMPPLKKMTGGAVRLYEHTAGPLGICEGIETAIAVHELADIPVWAALSATLLEKFEPPKNTKEIHIYGDNDKNFTGQKAAYNLANRLSIDGVKVQVYIPGTPGNDFLDDIQEQYE